MPQLVEQFSWLRFQKAFVLHTAIDTQHTEARNGKYAESCRIVTPSRRTMWKSFSISACYGETHGKVSVYLPAQGD